MTGLQTTIVIVLYIVLAFTVGYITFHKGHFVLGVLGIVLPFFWLIGALLPDRSDDMATGSGGMRPGL